MSNYLHFTLFQWWYKHNKTDGLVTQHLSPFEQNVTGSLFKDAKKKIVDKVVGFLLEAGPGLSFGIGLYTWGNWEYERTHYNHRA